MGTMLPYAGQVCVHSGTQHDALLLFQPMVDADQQQIIPRHINQDPNRP